MLTRIHTYISTVDPAQKYPSHRIFDVQKETCTESQNFMILGNFEQISCQNRIIDGSYGA